MSDQNVAKSIPMTWAKIAAFARAIVACERPLPLSPMRMAQVAMLARGDTDTMTQRAASNVVSFYAKAMADAYGKPAKAAPQAQAAKPKSADRAGKATGVKSSQVDANGRTHRPDGTFSTDKVAVDGRVVDVEQMYADDAAEDVDDRLALLEARVSNHELRLQMIEKITIVRYQRPA